MLSYYALGIGECRELARIKLLEEMVRPVGPPPRKDKS